MKIGISQSNYIPWLGYFEYIARCDLFVFLESVQYTKNDWRNRNQIMIQGKKHWLTVPVKTNNSLSIKLDEVQVAQSNWNRKHLSTIRHAYSKNSIFNQIKEQIKNYYEQLDNLSNLSEINIYLIREICKLLEINTEFAIYNTDDDFDKEQRIYSIIESYEAKIYVSSFKGFSYLNREKLKLQGVKQEILDYDLTKKMYSENSKKHSLSIIDTLSTCKVANVKNYFHKR